MINLHLPEPDQKYCVYCHRENALKGELIHFPHKSCESVVYLTNDRVIEPFSIWLYTCRWCRGADTRWKRKSAKK